MGGGGEKKTIFEGLDAVGLAILVEKLTAPPKKASTAKLLCLPSLPLPFSQSQSPLPHLVPFSGYNMAFLVVSCEAEIADPGQ